MKKFINKLKHPIKTKENFYSFCTNEVPEADKKITSINGSKVDIYKNFKFNSLDFDNCVDNSFLPYFDKDFERNILLKKELNENGVHSLSGSQSEFLDQQNNSGCDNHGEQIKRKLLSSNSLDSYNGDLTSDKSDCCKKQEELKKLVNGKETEKSRNNTYVIKITNSKNFYIGSQKTVTFNDNFGKNTLPISCTDNPSNSFERDKMGFLDCEKKLTENDITLISLNIDDKWKEFGKNLGVQECFLNQLEERNDNNRILITYDILQKFVKEYPNTSLGFVIKALNKSSQSQVIERLIENSEDLVAAL